jgi:2,3-bisphosphoglycerate-independent phosphoglycerate mutase
MDLEFIQKYVEPDATTKIVMLVMDGVGGLPPEGGGLTELEQAHTPNMDRLAREGVCGLHVPIAPGITPGSGPAHLALFGYDPIKYEVGRGVLSALGIDFDLQPGDVAARGNFSTVDEEGFVTDRRAGRIPTEKNEELSALLREIKIPGVEVFVEPVKEYRFLLVLRPKEDEELGCELAETDPLVVGELPLEPEALIKGDKDSERCSKIAKEFVRQAKEILADYKPANMVLLRGWSKLPDWPNMETAFGLQAAAIAMYPMYRGVSKLIGMEALPASHDLEEEFDLLKREWDNHDFFYVHVKRIDSAGEDGDFDRKVKLIEKTDSLIPRLMELNPDVVVITGDHSTPARMAYHSWHPVPLLIWSKFCRPDEVETFGERACMRGGLGPRLPGMDIMPIALANARRITKFGA